eukprot:TRINITY_DN67709_c11_g1_i1.p1 TRINITY_DN67709_c11_g1~~TRINITY_DN67709_c11_g1_i1.p1  ORF type:complete len:199 (+),score=1.77 TRINITY_DN67709_c11_g1_i1:297-893(+)
MGLGTVFQLRLSAEFASPRVIYKDQRGQDFAEVDFVAVNISSHCCINDLLAGLHPKYSAVLTNSDNAGILSQDLCGKTLFVERSCTHKPLSQLAKRMDHWMSCLDYEGVRYANTFFLILFNNAPVTESVLPHIAPTRHVKCASLWCQQFTGVIRWSAVVESQFEGGGALTVGPTPGQVSGLSPSTSAGTQARAQAPIC